MNSRAASPWACQAFPGYLSCSCVSRPGFAVVPRSRNHASAPCGRRSCWRSSGRGLLPRSWARGPAGRGEAAEDLGRDGQRGRQGPGKGKLGIPSMQCPPVLRRAGQPWPPPRAPSSGCSQGFSLGGQAVARCGGILPRSAAEDG
ncbi:uncharacterized protein LOC116529731 [Sapajus apella]|uniref:Uncharacterized protein LOC116529731 n=1 Tax=Sapajus apella TaxID=9515 RepID=A0A6J3FDM3_SAPAP|nr:uncharacterized protein LOC116529731 [Sapajus apella]